MSFILDALKKSDQLRQGAAAPTLSALPMPLPARRVIPVWLIVPAGFLLLVTGLLIGWWQPWGTKAEPSAGTGSAMAGKPVAEPVSLHAPVPAILPGADPRPARDVHQNARQAALPSARQSKPVQASPTPEVAERVEMAKVAKVAEIKSSPPALVMPPPSALPETSPPVEYGHLPAATQAELPSLSVTAHAYSKNPKASYVFIKDRMLHEGESLAPGLMLEQITAKGMVFNYRGQRFHRGLQP